MELLSDNKIYEVSNSRRVLTSLKKFTDAQSNSLLMGSDGMFGSSVMDGKMKIFTLKNLTESADKQLKESYFVESSYCVTDSEYFNFDNNELIVMGLDDGSFHVYDYGSKKDKSYERPIFRVTKDKASSAVELDSPNAIFKESMFEHSDSITSIERNFKDPRSFLTTGKDSHLNIWRFADSDNVCEF